MAVELEEEPVAGMASLGDAFGSVLNDLKADLPNENGSDNPPTDKPEPKEQPEPAKVPDPKVEPAKPVEKPDEKAQKPDPKTSQDAARAEKDKRRAKDIPLEEREFLLANEVKRLEVIQAKNKRIEELEAELNPTKAKVGELEKSVAEKTQLQSEIQALRQEKDNLTKEKQELNHKVSAYDIRSTSEYKQNVLEPWNKNVVGSNEAGKENGILGLGVTKEQESYLLSIVQGGNKANLTEFLAQFGGDENSVLRDDIRTIYKEGKALLAKHAEYEAKGPEALKEINERATKAEREKAEQSKKERNGYFGEIDAAATQHFPFLAGEGGNEGLNNALKDAKGKMGEFDYNKLNPAQQAYVAHLYAHSGIITHVQAQKLDQVSKELDKLKAEHAESDLKKDAEIEKLNERLGNQAGTRISAGSGKNRGDDGKFVSAGEITNVEQGFNKFLEQARRNS